MLAGLGGVAALGGAELELMEVPRENECRPPLMRPLRREGGVMARVDRFYDSWPDAARLSAQQCGGPLPRYLACNPATARRRPVSHWHFGLPRADCGVRLLVAEVPVGEGGFLAANSWHRTGSAATQLQDRLRPRPAATALLEHRSWPPAWPELRPTPER